MGNYELGDILGYGSTGSVYRAIHKQTKEVYAIKQCFAEDEEFRMNMFLDEARIMQSLSYIPNIIRIVEWFEKSGDFFIVLELCEYGDLIDAFLEPNEPYPIPAKVTLKILY